MSYTQRLWISFWPAAVAVGALAALVVFTSDHESQKIAAGIVGLLAGWSFIAAGLVAWSRRPDNHSGRLMVAVGFLFFIGALTDSNYAWVFSVSGAFSALFLAVFIHLLLAFPTGRLETRLERIVVALTYPTALLANTTTSLFETDPMNGCKGCPRNTLLVRDSHTAVTALSSFWDVVGIAIAVFVVVVLLRRWRRASTAGRRVLGPVLLSGGATIFLLGISFALDRVTSTGHDIAGGIAQFVFISVPYFFLAGLMRTRLARADFGRLFVEVPENPTPEDLHRAFRRALRDPSVRLAHWLPERELYVDLEGWPFEEPEGSRAMTLIEYEGRRVGAIVHDPSLLEEPELLEAAVATARIGLEKDRLQAELRARLIELERERDFVRTVVDTAPALFCVVDPEGRVMRFNQAVQRLSGVDDDEVNRGRFFWDLFLGPEEASSAKAALQESRTATDQGVWRESAWLSHDGGRRIIAWSLTPLVDAQGRPRFLIAGTDVTDRKIQEAELRRSRARIVEAADAERRRLERTLHDGAQQRLVSLSLGLRLAQGKLHLDPAAAEKLLVDAQHELSQALAELRELARGIHPAILTDRGLDAALEALAGRAPLPVQIVSIPEERLPGPVEAAAYYVVAEGLTNVVKYAEASSVQVSVERRNGVATVEIADDGIGGADPSGGTGLRGLSDRVEALDGRLLVESPAGGGTRIRAEIPVR